MSSEFEVGDSSLSPHHHNPNIFPRMSWGSLYALKGANAFQTMGSEWDDLYPKESFVIPFTLTALFLAIQVIHFLVYLIKKTSSLFFGDHSSQSPAEEALHLEPPIYPGTFKYLFSGNRNRRGMVIFGYAVAHLLGCLSLFVMSMKPRSRCRNWQHGLESTPWKFFDGCPETFMTLTYFYSVGLAVISMVFTTRSRAANRYNSILLLSAMVVYLYRDVWPLATYTESPKDSDDVLLWYKVTVLTLTSLVIPLFVPRQYIPVDPEDPMPMPSDEQTCSLISLIFFSYLDPVIFLGYRVPHLKASQLPPLSDSDYSKNLANKAFPHLDPYRGAKRRHLFFGLLRVFRREYMLMAFCVVGRVIMRFLSPIGINRILVYLETGGASLTIRPWFWVLCLFIGPTFSGLLFEWYAFMATRALTHTEALITQLVFEHSLRIRLVAETSPEGSRGGQIISNPQAPDTESVTTEGTVEGSTEGSDETSGASVAPTANKASPVSDDSQSATTAASTLPKGKDTGSAVSLEPLKTGLEATGSARKKDANLVGKINNLVTTDLGNIVSARDFLFLVLSAPLFIGGSIVFLYQLLGWSTFVGLGIMIALFPLPGYVSKMLQGVQKERMTMTDARVQDVTEVVNALRMVKLFGWEGRMLQRIKSRREDELKAIWKYKVLTVVNGLSNAIIPTVTMVATYAVYTTIMEKSLTPSIIFSSVSVFSILRGQLFTISWQISSLIQGKVSLDRVSDFLHKTELLDAFSDKREDDLTSHSEDRTEVYEQAIGFKNATFSWKEEFDDSSVTLSRGTYRLKVDDLWFKHNCINLIVGPTGSGKTSILMALLGEMHFIKSSPDSWFNLPREGGIAYAAQESWVQNDTIRNNILFGLNYDEGRYLKVIQQCALEKDLELFEAGDTTEVGEKGVTLSGGQKARITLARAIYSHAKIILLDDVLAALDVHTSAWIVKHCLRGELVEGRTVLLVTHNVALVAPFAGYIVSLSQDGKITQGADSKVVLGHDQTFIEEVDKEEIDVADDQGNLRLVKASSNGKLVIAEEIAEGHVTWKSVKMFLTALGGDCPFIFFSLLMTGNISTSVFGALQTWFLGYWGSKYEHHPQAEVKVSIYLSLYSVIVLGALAANVWAQIYYVYGTMRASRVINADLTHSVLSSTLRWLDATPTSRIISRCTQDMRTIDGPLPEDFRGLIRIGIQIMTNIGVIIILNPLFLCPGLGVAGLGFYLGNIYLKAQLSVKREMSNARSPVLAHFSTVMSGIVSVRAYGVQLPFKNESLKRIDHYVRIARMSYNLNRWIAVRIDILGTLFTACLTSYLVYGPFIGASNTGFSLNMMVEFSLMILFWVRSFNEFEVESNSLERIHGYIDIEHEPAATEEGKPPAAWPTSGDLLVENLSARYSQTGPNVLHDLSFHIKSGERVGVVGRTGSGKSSLTLALLRCIVTEGTVCYDGMPINKVNLDALRANITIIPQTPELISGSLRRNLDPFEQYDDAMLNDALQSAGLFSLHDEDADGRVTLDSDISAGGGNLSVGERQIIALARAMVRGSKLLILDEATSAIDYKTDTVIQTTLRHRLDPGVTVITVAHRLQTIMDADKIMVLEEGRIDISESLNVTISDTVASSLASDVEYRINQVIEEAARFMRHGRRTMMTTADVEQALKVLNIEPLYGHSPYNPTTFRRALPFPQIPAAGPVYFPEDEEIDFDRVLREEKIALPKGVSWTAHWLAVEGVQPLIPENPPAIPRESDGDPLAKGEILKINGVSPMVNGSGLPLGPGGNLPPGAKKSLPGQQPNQNQNQQIVKQVLSRELQLYYARLTSSLLPPSSDLSKRTAALASLRSDAGLQALLPYLVRWVGEGVVGVLKEETAGEAEGKVLEVLLDVIGAILDNTTLFVEPYLHQILPPILSILLHSSLPPSHAAQLRTTASQTLSKLLTQHSTTYPSLSPRIMKTLLLALISPGKSNGTREGAIRGLVGVGKEAVRKGLVEGGGAKLVGGEWESGDGQSSYGLVNSVLDALRVLQPQSDMADSLDLSKDTEILDKLKDVLGDFFASKVASDAAWAREILGLSSS